MKITAVLFALIVTASVSFAAEGDKKKPAEGAKPKPDLAAIFAKKDADSNGKVTKEEFLKGQKDPAKAEKQFANKDKDKDGSLTKEEFTAVGKKKEAK